MQFQIPYFHFSENVKDQVYFQRKKTLSVSHTASSGVQSGVVLALK